ncbi:hypothetical protein [Nonomuraea sp. B19D2]|uniref:hypothetical protein n=1 Tax=Nonomuraea sp. B19D2 TaxID=3159561 RepID=UPI0032DA6FE3
MLRLCYGGSAHRWGSAIYVASNGTDEDPIWFTGEVEDVFDLAGDLHIANADL